VTTVAIVVAGGAGRRLGGAAGVPKAFVALGDRPMFSYSVDAAESSGVVDWIVLVVPEGATERARALVGGVCVRDVVGGGETRQGSVRLGLAAVPAEVDVVVCHDAARPFASAVLFRRVVQALSSNAPAFEGIVPVLAPSDTVKRVAGGLVTETIPRAEIGLAQTPQAFAAAALRDAHARAAETGFLATDDAMVLEWAGGRVGVVDGEAANFKVTTPEDLAAAERIVAERRD
jgi:2-C-methyl-D-erythritol 4-phosphate cytidylyltransferase